MILFTLNIRNHRLILFKAEKTTLNINYSLFYLLMLTKLVKKDELCSA